MDCRPDRAVKQTKGMVTKIPQAISQAKKASGVGVQLTLLEITPRDFSMVIQASVWKFIINTDYGALNTMLKSLGIISSNVNWTPTPEAFFAWEIACGIFVTIPFVWR